jgi:PleD family two-component response regulator
MISRTPTVYLVNDLKELSARTGSVGGGLLQLLGQLTHRTADDSTNAAAIVGLFRQNSQIEITFQARLSQPVYFWFEGMCKEETYSAIPSTLPQVLFLHGREGLNELALLLENIGILEAGAHADPLAEDVFLRMRGDYLLQIEEEMEALLSPQALCTKAICEQTLERIIGSAGTYDFDKLGSAAENTLSRLTENAVIDKQVFVEGMIRAVASERDFYNSQIEARLPTAVELDVRQRVLVLADDFQIANQLLFALSHSRMQTTLIKDPAKLMSSLDIIQPDILVVLHHLKNFDGLDLASEVRAQEKYQALPILALLEECGDSAVTKAVRAGVDNWLQIPFSAANVALSVLNLLHRMEITRRLGGKDNLTGLYTKEAMIDRLASDLHRVSRSGQQLAVTLIRIRNSESPRQALNELALVAKRVFRRSDILARYNESTLAVLLPGIDARTVVSIFNRFRHVLDNRVSVEIATTIANGSATAESLIADVEIRLTRALGGSVDTALGILKSEEEDEKKSRAVPRILVADTDEAITNLLKFFCKREGFEVDDVRNGTDVIEYLQKADEEDRMPDLLVIESFLPGIDGFQILEKVQTDYGGRAAVIMLSVRPNEERIAKAFKLGAIDFIAKPFRVPEIIARIRNGLARTSAL